MKIAYIFPGQGSQVVGMGKDLYEKYEEVRDIYTKASNLLNVDIANLTFNSSEEELAETENSQIAIFVMSLGILELLKKYEIEVDCMAGLSLGEYTALTATNSFDFESAIKIVKKRSDIMKNNIPEGKWQMAGILGLTDEQVNNICKNVTSGFVVPANYNCPGQVVVSGDEEGISQVTKMAKEQKARKVVVIKTKGPFHTGKLEVVSKKLEQELKKLDINTPNKKVYKNIDATIYSEKDNMVDILSKHVMSPVRFSQIIQDMVNTGIDTFVEIGPGKVLTGLVKRVSRDVELININGVDSLENAISKLEKKRKESMI